MLLIFGVVEGKQYGGAGSMLRPIKSKGMRMRKIILMALLVISPFCAYADTSTKLVRTGETIQIPYKLDIKEIEAAILDGSVRRGWEPKKLSDGTIEDTLHIRSHIAVVHVVYTTESFRIDYADSTNLTSSGSAMDRYASPVAQYTIGATINSLKDDGKEGEVRIHKNYYVWTQNLANYIMDSLGEAKKKSDTAALHTKSESVPDKLRALDALRKDGIISAEEYQKKKQQLLEQF